MQEFGGKSLGERFEDVVSLFEATIEEHLSILEEKDEWHRDMLLTTDIDSQIAHWSAIREKLEKLKAET